VGSYFPVAFLQYLLLFIEKKKLGLAAITLLIALVSFSFYCNQLRAKLTTGLLKLKTVYLYKPV